MIFNLSEKISKEALKLEPILSAAHQLGDPHLNRKTILIAGTNGKGSVTAYLTALFVKAGLKVGTMSSPHVIAEGERIRKNGKPSSEQELLASASKLEKVFEPLTYFERMTLLGFYLFREWNVDLQIIEVGIGGRLDATNIVDPDGSIIMPIGYDHQEILGSTLTEIAKEKAGIMRAGKLAISAPQLIEAKTALEHEAIRMGSDFYFTSSETIVPFSEELERKHGPHQCDNARVAIEVFNRLSSQWNLKMPGLTAKFWSEALWPARTQWLRENPPILVDGAHNEESMIRLVDLLKTKNIKWDCWFGAVADKPVDKMIDLLLPWVDQVYASSFYPERELSRVQITALWNSRGKSCLWVDDSKAKLKELRASSKPLLITGSFYLAGAVLRDLNQAS